MKLLARQGEIDNSSDNPVVYESKGHSFYVSIVSGAKCDAKGYYNLSDLVVHDPRLLSHKELLKGMGFYDYLKCFSPNSDELFFAFEFFADPRSLKQAPIPSSSFSFTAPSVVPPESVFQPPSPR